MTGKRKGRPAVLSRLPRRYKKRGKEVGAYYIRIDGKDVNLRTTNAELALKRAKEARAGKRDFVSDSGAGAARVVADALAGTGGATTPPVVEPPRPAAPEPTPSSPAHTAAAALPPIGRETPTPPPTPPPGEAPKPPPVQPDGYIPPPPGWAQAAAAAAAAAGGAARAADEADLEDELGAVITPEDVEKFIDDAATYAVGLQLWGQAWLAAHMKPVAGVNIKVAPVGDSALGVTVGKKIWKRWFRKLVQRYMPNLDAPEWLLAPIMVASLTLPIQFGPGAEAIRDDDKPKEETPAAPAAPAAA